MNTRRKWFYWWGWSTTRLEGWLEQMAARGWHLVKADHLLLRFHFAVGEPKRVRVCIDYQSTVNDEYHSLFSDAGWELVAEGYGYYIWRSEYEDARRPEIFSDIDSLIDRNRRIFSMMMLALLIQPPAWVVAQPVLTRVAQYSVGRVLLALYVLVLVIGVGSLTAILRQNRRLRRMKRP